MTDQDLGRRTLPKVRVHGRAIHRVAEGRVATVGPIHEAIAEIELQIDRLGQGVEQHFDVAAVGCIFTFRDFDPGAKDAALPRIILSFLRPVNLSTVGVHRDSDAPFPRVAAGTRIALARIHERLELRAIEIAAHDLHSLAVGPIELAVLPIEMELLRRERLPFGNNRRAILPVEIRALNGSVVPIGNAHVGPEDVSGLGIYHYTVRPMAIGYDDSSVRAVRIYREDVAAAQIQNDETAHGSLGAGCELCLVGFVSR